MRACAHGNETNVRTLYTLSYSPWSERARWALDYHGVKFVERHHVPMLGEPFLRLWTRRARGVVTVPLLVDGDLVLGDSYLIARWADSNSRNGRETLFPEAAQGTILTWNERAGIALQSARALVIAALARDEEALLESVPRALRSLPGARATARLGLAHFRRKYALDEKTESAHLEALELGVDQLREDLGGRKYLVDRRFTYADILGATLLQSVVPVADEFLRLGPATRRTWTRSDLAERSRDLLGWRDEIYRAFRHTQS
jgi:glutathione S-transferase